MDSSSASSRFVSQGDIDQAKARREEQWKAAYARLGQEPPPKAVEDTDTRSLAEKLAANKIAKQEEWEERSKLANQFRALEEDEVAFLDAIQEKRDAEERQRRVLDGEELKNFREAVVAHQSSSKPPPQVSPPAAEPVKPKQAPVATKKDLKKSLKGVVVKKKAKAPAAQSSATSVDPSTKKRKDSDETTSEPDPKRRKQDESKS